MKSPFENLSKIQVNKLYELLGVHIYKYKKNQEILPTIKNENIIYYYYWNNNFLRVKKHEIIELG